MGCTHGTKSGAGQCRCVACCHHGRCTWIWLKRLAVPGLNQGWDGEPALASWKRISGLKHSRASFDHKLVIKHKREKVLELTFCHTWNTGSTYST